MNTQTKSTPPAADEAAHTPTPWKVDDACGNMIFCGRIGGMVAKTFDNVETGSDKCAIPNARFIVEACNSHASLVADRDALRKALENIRYLAHGMSHTVGLDRHQRAKAGDIEAQAAAALASSAK